MILKLTTSMTRLGVGIIRAKRQARAMAFSLQQKQCWSDNGDFFRFTRGRFLRDETHELSSRYARFNVNELAQVAAQTTAPGSHHCVKIEKLADGMHNKALLLTMDNGIQVVGKIPNPNAGRPYFTTASEVATMEFMRNVMGTPVPKVLAWSSTSDNGVGAEYIIMEKLNGVQLDTIWDQLDVDVKFKVVKKIAKYQKDWTSTSFSQFGGLYYKQDLPSTVPSLTYTNNEGKQITDDRFAVGPSTSRQNVDDGRTDIDFDRGPWNTAKEYEVANGLREISCIQQLPKLPKSPIALYCPITYRPSREKKLQAARSYLKIVDYLLPEDDSIRTSHLWHDDLHTENIFVNPDDPSEIYGFVDWQSTELAPLYDHTLEPYVLDYDGPPVEGLLDRPKLSEVQELFDTEPDPVLRRKKAESLFVKMSLVSLYRHLVHKTNKRLFRALQFRETTRFQLLLFARNLLVDGEATYLGLLAELQQQTQNKEGSHDGDSDLRFPFSLFSEGELRKIEMDSEGAALGIRLMQEVQEQVGQNFFSAQGLVSHEQLDEAKQALRRAKKDFVQKYARNKEEVKEFEKAWPFDD